MFSVLKKMRVLGIGPARPSRRAWRHLSLHHRSAANALRVEVTSLGKFPHNRKKRCTGTHRHSILPLYTENTLCWHWTEHVCTRLTRIKSRCTQRNDPAPLYGTVWSSEKRLCRSIFAVIHNGPSYRKDATRLRKDAKVCKVRLSWIGLHTFVCFMPLSTLTFRTRIWVTVFRTDFFFSNKREEKSLQTGYLQLLFEYAKILTYIRAQMKYGLTWPQSKQIRIFQSLQLAQRASGYVCCTHYLSTAVWNTVWVFIGRLCSAA